MTHLGRIRLPATAWTPPLVLALVVAIVEFYLLIFFHLVVSGGRPDDFLRHQSMVAFSTGEGALPRGLLYEFMKLNLFLGIYIWLMSRTLDPRRRLGLLIASLVLALMQVLLFLSSNLPTTDFTFIRIDLSTR